MTTSSGGPITYFAVAASAPVSVWLTTVESWMALVIGGLTIAVLIVRLVIDWPRLMKRLRRKGGG